MRRGNKEFLSALLLSISEKPEKAVAGCKRPAMINLRQKVRRLPYFDMFSSEVS